MIDKIVQNMALNGSATETKGRHHKKHLLKNVDFGSHPIPGARGRSERETPGLVITLIWVPRAKCHGNVARVHSMGQENTTN